MTKEMVLEFTSEKIYKISKAVRDGNYIEKWEFDLYKLTQEIKKEKGQHGLNTFWRLALMEGLVADLASQSPTLIFTNGKLTDVIQN
jgi:hypothetical protein